MRPITFILCRAMAEAVDLAVKHQLPNWQFLGHASIVRGHKQPIVWRTQCWFYDRTREQRHEIRMVLAETEATVTRIDCLHGGRIPAGENA